MKVMLTDGMLIETGGRFGREENLSGYMDSCVELARRCIENGAGKSELLKIIDSFLGQYREETTWRYYDAEMYFLNGLRNSVEHL